ncbi:thioesterase domain-containing protein [Streptomyces sp. NPDC006460]|uniref:thioesterase II family protein n=1 Tax=Streptomyces sp. NPDC006460 TaxID=3154304 RepID=UPI0033B5F62E
MTAQTPHDDLDPAGRRWLRLLGPAVGGPPHARLVCLPHAGGAATAYLGWVRHLPPRTELFAVQYPGRQDRLAEPCVESMTEMADRVAAALAGLPPLPTVVFGHSMGSLVAYEALARVQRRHPAAVPERLFVSGTAAPHRDREGLPALDDASLVAYTHRQGGAFPGVYEDPELRELLLPSLRGDFRLLAGYRPAAAPTPLGVPVTALGGDRDTGCTAEDLRSWAALTTGAFATRTFPGGHFYLQDGEEHLVHLVTAAPLSAANR